MATTTTHESGIRVNIESGIDTLEPVHRDAYATVYHGDCLNVMRHLPANSVDACLTDPPYGLTDIDEAKTRLALDAWLGGGDDAFVPDGKGFMGKRWDQFVPPPRRLA